MSRRGGVVVALFALGACSSKPPPSPPTPLPSPAPQPADAAPPADAALQPPAPGCPARFGADVYRPCGEHAPCDYPEGRCECVMSGACSGVVSRVEPRWRCMPTGCPWQIPSGACSAPPSLKCGYGGGCVSEILSCVSGQWQVVARPAAPP